MMHRCATRPAVLRSMRRAFCKDAGGNGSVPKQYSFGAGLVGGAVGGLVGLGGGVVMIPIMTSNLMRLTQHQAVGTSSAAVAGTGVAGCLSYGTAGAVDLVGAMSIGAAAMLTARAGAKATSLFSPLTMQRIFAIFQMGVAPMVPIKGYLARQQRQDNLDAVPAGEETSASPATGATVKVLQLGAVGAVAGFASGMFGIGGGVMITPALCLFTDMSYTCVLGTTLASMVAPSLVSASTHWQIGNVVGPVVLPLVAGSACGAFMSGQVAVRVPEEPLQVSCTAKRAMHALSPGARLWSSMPGPGRALTYSNPKPKPNPNPGRALTYCRRPLFAQWAFAVILFAQGALKLWAIRGR
jgi:uncharacterized membrane protein YfcA